MKSKQLIIQTMFFIIIAFSSFTIDTGNDWNLNIKEAKKEASEKKQYILLSFQGSDWCGNCIRLERTLFDSEEFKSFAKENLVLLKADFPMKKKNKLSDDQTKHNEGLADKFNKKGGFPTVVILDSEGKLKGIMSYPLTSSEDYIKDIKKMIK